MVRKVVNSSLVLLSKFGVSQQLSASKIGTSHIRKTLNAKSVCRSFFHYKPLTLPLFNLIFNQFKCLTKV